MSYPEGEANLLATFRVLSDWDQFNSSSANWDVLNSGADDKYLILKPGEFKVQEFMSLGNKTSVRGWTTKVEIWKMYKEFGVGPTALQNLVDTVVGHIEKYPYGGAGASSAYKNFHVLESGEMEERWQIVNGPKWLMWEIVIQWEEFVNVTLAE